MRTTAIAAAVTAAVLVSTLGACSSGEDGGRDDRKPTSTAAATPTVDAAAQREACVTAWAEAIQAGQDDIDQEPEACEGLPAGDRLDRYMEGMQQRNKANRDQITECVEDSTCTSVPVP